jgi:hypothetical protein
MRRRLFVCSVAVAVLGLLAAALIYSRVGDDDGDPNVQVVIVDGKTYRIPLASTRAYQGDLQRFGGNAAVLFDDIDRWFAGLWHGRSLAVTTAWITAFVSVGLYLIARGMPPDQTSPGRGGHEDG